MLFKVLSVSVPGESVSVQSSRVTFDVDINKDSVVENVLPSPVVPPSPGAAFTFNLDKETLSLVKNAFLYIKECIKVDIDDAVLYFSTPYSLPVTESLNLLSSVKRGFDDSLRRFGVCFKHSQQEVVLSFILRRTEINTSDADRNRVLAHLIFLLLCVGEEPTVKTSGDCDVGDSVGGTGSGSLVSGETGLPGDPEFDSYKKPVKAFIYKNPSSFLRYVRELEDDLSTLHAKFSDPVDQTFLKNLTNVTRLVFMQCLDRSRKSESELRCYEVDGARFAKSLAEDAASAASVASVVIP